MKSGNFLIVALLMGAIGAGLASTPARAAPTKARISGLGEVAFGLIAGTSDQSASQNLCAFSANDTNLYSVTATGSGTGGTFALSSGAGQLPYDVLWAAAPDQTGGTQLVAGTAAPGFLSNATQQTCNSGPAASASLTVVIRSATLMAAAAGDYSGTLQVTIAPE
jgi:hypothetical protein